MADLRNIVGPMESTAARDARQRAFKPVNRWAHDYPSALGEAVAPPGVGSVADHARAMDRVIANVRHDQQVRARRGSDAVPTDSIDALLARRDAPLQGTAPPGGHQTNIGDSDWTDERPPDPRTGRRPRQTPQSGSWGLP